MQLGARVFLRTAFPNTMVMSERRKQQEHRNHPSHWRQGLLHPSCEVHGLPDHAVPQACCVEEESGAIHDGLCRLPIVRTRAARANTGTRHAARKHAGTQARGHAHMQTHADVCRHADTETRRQRQSEAGRGKTEARQRQDRGRQRQGRGRADAKQTRVRASGARGARRAPGQAARSRRSRTCAKGTLRARLTRTRRSSRRRTARHPTVRARNKQETQRRSCDTAQEPKTTQTYKPRSFQRKRFSRVAFTVLFSATCLSCLFRVQASSGQKDCTAGTQR